MHGFGTVTSELDMYANDIKRSLTPLILLTKHETRSREALKKVNNQLTQNWKNNKELSKTASSRKVRDGFIQIQSLLKKELQGSLTTLINAIDTFDNDFLKFPLRGNKMEIAWGAAPYDRWINLQFKYPCRKEVTKTFTEEGFSEDFTWSTFSPCTFTAQRVDLPKGWLPYLKYRFVKG
jgi:translation initiation factor 1 (eIF-1/SUI1)